MVQIQSIEGGVKFVFQDNTLYLQNGTIIYPLNSLAMVIDESNAVTFKLPNNDIALSVHLSELGKTKEEMEQLYAEAFVGDTGGGVTPEDVEALIDEAVSPIEEELERIDGVVTAHTANTEIHVTAQDKQTWNAKADQASVDALQATVTAHTANTEIHVTAQDKQTWNAKADATDLDALEAQLAAKADATDVESQFEVAAIAMTKLDEEKADKADTYTKAETDAAIASGSHTYTAGRGIAISNDVISFNLAISASTGTESVVQGDNCRASGNTAHAEGGQTHADGATSHSEGQFTIASGTSSHAEGNGSQAIGNYSHAEGMSTIAYNQAEHSQGHWNVSHSASTTFGDSGNTLFSIGNGTANNARHNAVEVRQNGDIYIVKDGQDVRLQDQLGGSITIDPSLDSGSTNAVANSAITAAIDSLQGQIDTKEEVISTALNDLEEGKLDVSAYTPTDLSNYYTKSETDTALANKANTATTYTKSEVDALIQSLESAIAAQLGGLSFVEISQSDYDALPTKAPHTVYIING